MRWSLRTSRRPSRPQLLVPGGQLPLPTRYRLFFGDPMHFEGDPEDKVAVAHQVHLVKEAISHILRRGLAQRKSVFF